MQLHFKIYPKAVVRRCSVKIVSLKISQYSQESALESLFNKVAGLYVSNRNHSFALQSKANDWFL